MDKLVQAVELVLDELPEEVIEAYYQSFPEKLITEHRCTVDGLEDKYCVLDLESEFTRASCTICANNTMEKEDCKHWQVVTIRPGW